ncbi:PKD domain-containing protein [Fulvivirga lutea]|uniref:PKD domain-containing protein n=1 Tax=Fulvivirga lutea TaxID=2810512 RepID=A0A974WKD0_9BACT|nr:PKD domain-containing protein [Fulvivirga lutea]QSE98812.1 PKD domain-containing protein [Fulvivirga lutea]
MRALLSLLICISFVPTFGQSESISASKYTGCIPFSVSFSYTGGSATSYLWDFGNGKTSTVASPSISYEALGSYEVKLTVNKSDGSSSQLTLPKIIKAIAYPEVKFSTAATSVCINSPIDFFNTTTDAVRYVWDFGDGKTSVEKNPQHTYTKSGKYTVSLIAYNEEECSKVLTKTNLVEVIGVEEILIAADDRNSCISSPTVSFDTSVDYDSYAWDFGDGGTSNLSNPVHTYTQTGAYDISVEVTSENGCSAKKSFDKFIHIYDLPNPIIAQSDSIICEGSVIDFSGNFKTTDAVLWQFSDGFTTDKKQFSKDFTDAGIYTYTVQVTSKEGCTNTIIPENSIDVKNISQPDIDLGITEGCIPFVGHLVNNTPGVLSSEWVINGKKLVGPSTDFELNDPGKYSLKAILTYSSGCTKTVEYDSIFNIYSAKNKIIASSISGCSPVEIEFTLEDQKVTNPFWEIGGITSTEINPVLTFDNPGEYPVSVHFINKFGCDQQLNLKNMIRVFPNEIEYDTPEQVTTCQSTEVFFNGDVGKDFWEWDFGDGVKSNEPHPVHSYEKIGTYTVTLRTNNIHGCESYIDNYNQIEVDKVEAKITSNLVDTTAGCPNFTIQFNTEKKTGASYFWDFENGTTSTDQNPIIDFSTNGQTNVQLTVTNENGCSNTTSQLISSPWPYCSLDDEEGDNQFADTTFVYKHIIKLCGSPAEVNFTNPRWQAESWLWDFGDGTNSTEKFPSHIYTNDGHYYVGLISYYDNGNIDTLDVYSEVIIEKPNANFSYLEEFNCSGYTVTFNQDIDNYKSTTWDFGDGQLSLDSNPTHTYKEQGVYQVSLKVEDASGCTSKVLKNVIVGNDYVIFDYPTNLCENDSLIINHNIKGFETLVWDFGDGEVSTEDLPVHAYKNAGTYQIQVKAHGLDGCSQNITLPEEVTYNTPKADFIVNKTDGCNSLNVTFTNNSTDASSFLWLFGDSSTSSKVNVSHQYNSGTYDVELIATNNSCSNTLSRKNLIVVDSISADFSYSQEQTCLPAKVDFINNSKNAVSWQWDFGDGTISTEENPSHIFNSVPDKPVQLTAISDSGCSITVKKQINSFLTVDFAVSNTEICKGQELVFNNQSKGAKSYIWDFGDGTTSDLINPVHTFSEPGLYDITLIATSIDGCNDKVVKTSYIKVNYVEAEFEIGETDSKCAPLLIDFTNNSKNATQYHWDFGDGAFSSSVDPIHVYSDIGQFDVTIIASDDIGCSDTLIVKDAISSKGPNSKIVLSDSIVCHPDQITFNDTSTVAVRWEWLFGDGNSSSLKSPSHEYELPGVYDISLVSYDDNGCNQFTKFDSVVVIPTPKASFEVDTYNQCLPVSIDITNKSSNLQNPTFKWLFGDDETSTLENPEHTYTKPGVYQIKMEVSNEGFCTDSFELSEKITVYDTTFRKQPDIYRISVIDNQEIDINYDEYKLNNLKYHVLYKKCTFEPDYLPYDTLWSTSNDLYRDLNVKLNENPYHYKIQSQGYCYEPAPLEDLIQYKTIYVKSELIRDSIQLTWNHYEGHDFENYLVSRRPEGGDWEPVEVISKDQNSYKENEALCPGEYYYCVRALNLNGSQYYSESNFSSITVEKNMFEQQHVNIVRTTVVDDQSILTEWNEPTIASDKVVGYDILRKNGNEFELIDYVPKGITSYYDEEVDVQSESFTYQIRVINECDIETTLSGESNSILLQKTTDNYVNKLNWTPYQGWHGGVSKYKLQKLDEYGQWITVEEIDSTNFKTVIDLSKE